MHRAIEFVRPCGVRKDALDAQVHFRSGLFGSHHLLKVVDRLVPPLLQVLGAVIQNLGAIVCSSL